MKEKIAIIGAGLAGLTSGYRLKQKGYDVEIFEARTRVGGRVQSIYVKNLDGGYSIGELGGGNIKDGGEASNILSLAKELGVQTQRLDLEFSRAFYDGHQFYDHHQLLQEYYLKAGDLKKILASLPPNYKSMQEVLNYFFKDDPILKRIFAFLLSGYEGSPPESLSIYHNLDTLEYMLDGGLSPAHQTSSSKPIIAHQSFKGGNSTLPEKIAEKLQNHIQLEKALKQVEAGEANKITLTFADGTTGVFDKLILAMPCSVYEDIIFDERLIPVHILNEIKLVQYGTNAKIMLPVKYTNLPYNSLFNDKMSTFFNSDKKLFNMYFVSSSGAGLYKDLSKLYAEGMTMLKRGYNNFATFSNNLPVVAVDENFKRYDSPVAKSWMEDSYSKGSYSNYGIALNEKLAEVLIYKGVKVRRLFAPLNDKVFFAGEHATTLDEIGTMEAAVESGELVAQFF